MMKELGCDKLVEDGAQDLILARVVTGLRKLDAPHFGEVQIIRLDVPLGIDD